MYCGNRSVGSRPQELYWGNLTVERRPAELYGGSATVWVLKLGKATEKAEKAGKEG